MSKVDAPIFYVRVTDFDYDSISSEVGPPRLAGKPVSEAEHVLAYGNILFSTRDAVIRNWFGEMIRNREAAADARSVYWVDNTVCAAEVDEYGRINCFKRVAIMNADGVEMIDREENFYLSVSREEIFEMAEVEDHHKVAASVLR